LGNGTALFLLKMLYINRLLRTEVKAGVTIETVIRNPCRFPIDLNSFDGQTVSHKPIRAGVVHIKRQLWRGFYIPQQLAQQGGFVLAERRSSLNSVNGFDL
jgi:hypothetical protein